MTRKFTKAKPAKREKDMALTVTARVPASTPCVVGQNAKLIISLEGPATIRLGDPVKPGGPSATNRDISCHFALDPAIAKVVNVKPLQVLGPRSEFSWSKTTSAAKQFKIRQTIAYTDPTNAVGFDVAMAPMYEVEIQGVKAGSTTLDVIEFKLGAHDIDTSEVDGQVVVA